VASEHKLGDYAGTLEPAQATQLLRRQDVLQAEVRQVLADLNLMTVLTKAGRPMQIGSSVLGLMTWRDIDIHVYCNPVSADLAFETMRPLASHPGITKLRYANWRGPFATATLPDGYYWGVRYDRGTDQEWKIDVWFLPEDAPRPELEHLETIKGRLTPESRLAILWLKDIWHRHPTYRHGVGSMDIYDAVLKQGVRTPAAFETYLVERGKLGR
jgi:hypothetical protein